MSSLHPEAVPLGCWHQVGMGLVGPLPETERGHEYNFCFSDYFSKWPTAVPLKIKLAYEVANVLTGVICSYGCFKTLTTNQGGSSKRDTIPQSWMCPVCRLLLDERDVAVRCGGRFEWHHLHYVKLGTKNEKWDVLGTQQILNLQCVPVCYMVNIK